MSANDHALVVGITKYPALGDLAGPENDALDFAAWLEHPKGGNVPKANIRLVLSSNYPSPMAGQALRAQPSTEKVREHFDDLYAIGAESGTTGDRLYLYFAGHGFAKDIESSALLMANAARGAVGRAHIPGKPFANFFRQAGFVKEVVLFMDCCREIYTATTLASVGYEDRNSATPGRRYCGFATQWSLAAREIPYGPDNVSRGLFTLALLNGLREGARRDADGRVTGADLEAYVVNYVQKAGKPDTAQEPEFDYSKTADLLFNAPPNESACNPLASPALGRATAGHTIRLKKSPALPAFGFELVDGGLLPIPPLLQVPDWVWQVPRAGFYKLKRSDGVAKLLEVFADQEVSDASF